MNTGADPVVLSTPESREEARQWVYDHAVQKGSQSMRITDFRNWLNTELFSREVKPVEEEAVRKCIFKRMLTTKMGVEEFSRWLQFTPLAAMYKTKKK